MQSYDIVPDANFNFQLNRVIFWNGGDADEVHRECKNIRTSEEWDALQCGELEYGAGRDDCVAARNGRKTASHGP